MPSDTTLDTSSIAPAIKKQKTSTGENDSIKSKKKASPSASQPVKTVKSVDPAIIEQRREAVQARVLKLESKLAKDRALLAKYSVRDGQVGEVVGKDSGEEEEQGAEPNGVGDE